MSYLIYGATGYTAQLIVREALRRGQRPILAGRNPAALAELARATGLEHRCFTLDDPSIIDRHLQEVGTVLHCAGPFAHTSKAMADACLRTSNHYLDITGEIEVFESLAARAAEARSAGVMMMPGVGFDVVPSDCLAAHLKRRLPSATHLALGMLALSRLSRGTATTMVENLPRGGLVRQGGVLTKVRAAWKTRDIDFGAGPVRAVTIPWGDVSTAYHSTHIPNIEVYSAMPLGIRIAARLSRYLGWALGSAPVQRFLKKRIQTWPPGPTDDERQRGKCILWGEARDESGQCVVSRLLGPEGYTWTVLSALAVMERVLAGNVTPGFQTPSTAYGPDFVLGIEGVVREDVPFP